MVALNKRVLVVDDEEVVCEACRRVLSSAGFSVSTVQSGREALEACRSERFDLVVADIRMPDMDGLEVAQRLKQEFPELQVLILTGYPSEESLRRARRIGVFDYLHKPVSPERLSAVTTAAALAPPAQPELTEPGQELEQGPVSAAPTVAASTETPERPAETLGLTAPATPVRSPELPAAARTVAGSDQPTAETPQPPESLLKTVLILAGAPLVGLAYILFLPLFGFGALVVAASQRALRLVGLRGA